MDLSEIGAAILSVGDLNVVRPVIAFFRSGSRKAVTREPNPHLEPSPALREAKARADASQTAFENSIRKMGGKVFTPDC